MLNFLSNIKNKDNIKKNTKILASGDTKFAKIKRNILQLIFDDYSLNSDKNLKRKNYSQPNSKYRRIYLQKKININNKGKSKKDIIKKKEKNKDSYELNIDIIEDEKPLNLDDFLQQKNKELKDKEMSNKEKLNNKNMLPNNNSNINVDKRMSKDSKDLIEKMINQSGGSLNINDKSSNNDIINVNKFSSKELSSNNNSNKNINILNYYSNSNTNKSNTNYAYNFFGVYNQEDNSSINSSKNELSPKDMKINNNNNNKISNLSSSSFGKNFVLKSEICKSTFHNENKYYTNNKSEDNPIMTYYSKDYKRKNFGNFYLFTDRKSVNEYDQNHQNRYLNFFPIEENHTKKKEKNIMSCNYIENNNEIPEKINTDIINENNDYSRKYNFILNEFHGGTNKENKLNLEKLIKKFENTNNNDVNSNKTKIDTIFENDDIDIDNNINKNNEIDNDMKENNCDNKNIIDNNNSIENNINSKFDYSLNNNNNNINNNRNLINNNDNNMQYSQVPLSFINNIYNINNSNYKQYQINPILNPGIPNYFYNYNMSINPFMNCMGSNFQNLNFYPQLYNQKNFNQYQNNYFKSLNNQNNQNDINSINNKNNNININNVDIDNNNKKGDNTNNIKNNDNKSNNMNNNDISNNNQNSNYHGRSFFEYSDEEILNMAVILINDQYGCRFMQEKVKSNHHFANELLFPKIKYNLKEICNDCFGNYFLQILIDILSFDNINKFFDMTQNDFTEICISPHGTRVIQKIIEKISSTPILLNRFIYNIDSRDLGIIFKSPYGNHMIQKYLATIHSSEYSNFIFNYIYKKFLDITNSKHGVCVVQKCVSEGDEKQRDKLYELILNNFNNIIKDQFGNYLIQYILINTKTEEKFKEILPIILKIEENFVDFCKSKFSANAIEKCFENSDDKIKEHILNSFLQNYSENIIDILLDHNGIYVIQKALKIKNSINKNKLVELINGKEKELKNINFGDYKYKNILKIINSNKELGETLGKIIKINNNNNNEINNNEKNNNKYDNVGEIDNRNEHYNYNNRGKNKRGRKNYRNNNNRY